MSNEITLQSLVEKVKSDLVSAPVDPENMFFFVEKVELELAVSIAYEIGAGIKVTLLNFLGSEITGKHNNESGHTIKVTLTPVLSIEEQRSLLAESPELRTKVERATRQALWKTGDSVLVGNPE